MTTSAGLTLWVTLAVCARVANAYPNGAPDEVCSSMTPNHGSSIRNYASNPFDIVVSNDSYSSNDTMWGTWPGRFVKNQCVCVAKSPSCDVAWALCEEPVCVCCKVSIVPSWMDVTIRGFLVQARPAATPNDNTRYGTFLDGTVNQVRCNGQAATHLNRTDKDVVRVQWRAPSQSVGDIVFRVTVVRIFRDYYLDLQSDVLAFKAQASAP